MNQLVRSQKIVRGLKFWILRVEEMFSTKQKRKGLISCAIAAQLICVFVLRKCEKQGFF